MALILDPRILINPLRPFVQKYYDKVMESYIRKELDRHFIEMKANRSSIEKSRQSAAAKSVISLAIEAYINENEGNLMQKSRPDEHFAQYATYQIRLFLFAGNDTTSSTMVYVYHLLSQHPEALSTLRKEHDDVFGTDTRRAAQILKEQPAMINKCLFTLAVIKETLRLYPPAATMRAGQPGITITDRHRNHCPMDYVGATVLHQAVHRNPACGHLQRSFYLNGSWSRQGMNSIPTLPLTDPSSRDQGIALHTH